MNLKQIAEMAVLALAPVAATAIKEAARDLDANVIEKDPMLDMVVDRAAEAMIQVGETLRADNKPDGEA